MGVGPSVDMSVPPGGSMITLQSPQECFQTRPKFNETWKPDCMSMIDDARWNDFVGKLTVIVGSYFNEMIPFMIVPLGFAAMIGIWFVPLTMDDTPFPQFAGAIVAFATILVVSVGRLIVVTKNTAEDQKIHQLCSELTTATQGAIQVQYRTAWTCFCKPKHARTARLIVFCPRTSMGPVTIPIPGAAPIQSIMITVPPGVVPGQQLQVQTPTGIQTATVPEGVGPGQSFTFTPGAPVVVQAQVVHAEVVDDNKMQA